MHLYTPATPAKHIPVIDLLGGPDSQADKSGIVGAIHRACRDTGFFYVTNHGVPGDLVSGQFDQSKAFFSLPEPEKLSLHISKSVSKAGYSGFGSQILDSQDASKDLPPADLHESFYVGNEVGEDHSHVKRKLRGFGYNQWPENLPSFKSHSLKYHSAMTRLGNHIMSLLAASLDLNPGWFAPSFVNSMSAVRMLRYPPQTEVQNNQLGAGAHTDWSAMTILAQDNVGGLEVRNRAGEWIKAPPIEGAFVINLGDLMARWTNGIYMSNFHRVVNNTSGKDRYSIAFFHGPNPDWTIEPIATCLTSDNPQRFATCTAGEHLSEMYRRAYQKSEGVAVANA